MDNLLNPLVSIEVALSSWPDITLQVSEHFYVIFWFAIIFLVIILFNLALITTGMIVYAGMTLFNIRRGPKLEGYAFANFGNSSGARGNCTSSV